MNSRLAPEIRRKGMWCHLFGLSSALWIFAWIVADGYIAGCKLSHITHLLIPIVVQAQAQKVSQIWIGLANACIWIIPLLMLLLGPSITLANWLHKRNFHPFVDAQGKESFNFQLSVSICILLVQFFFSLYLFQTQQSNGEFGIPSSALLWTGLIIAIAFFPLLTVLQSVLVIFAASKAANGQNYRYPFTMRFFK